MFRKKNSKEADMAANRQQGGYLAAFIVAFVALPAGAIALSSNPIIGVILGLGGLALMILSLVGFYRIKPLESMND
jgi:hypothetical protein